MLAVQVSWGDHRQIVQSRVRVVLRRTKQCAVGDQSKQGRDVAPLLAGITFSGNQVI